MFNDFKEDTKSNVRATWNVAWWVVVTGVILLVITLAGLAFTPTFRNLWIKMFRSSNQYVTTKQTLLFELMDEHERLETKIVELSASDDYNPLVNALRGQQKSIIDRMNREVDLLRPDQVPLVIRSFLLERGD